MISKVEQNIIKLLQDDFPIVAEPYKELAKKAGISEQDFIGEVKSLKEDGVIRKMGAVLRHREVGFKANALCAWIVPENRVEEVAKKMVECPAITHCYDRNTEPDWPYNFYTMVHAKTREECENIVNSLADETGLEPPNMLYSKKEWKKSSMRYFEE